MLVKARACCRGGPALSSCCSTHSAFCQDPALQLSSMQQPQTHTLSSPAIVASTRRLEDSHSDASPVTGEEWACAKYLQLVSRATLKVCTTSTVGHNRSLAGLQTVCEFTPMNLHESQLHLAEAASTGNHTSTAEALSWCSASHNTAAVALDAISFASSA